MCDIEMSDSEPKCPNCGVAWKNHAGPIKLCEQLSELQERLRRIKEHWEDGVSEDTERENSWHGTMRDILEGV